MKEGVRIIGEEALLTVMLNEEVVVVIQGGEGERRWGRVSPAFE
jgi:hypothetical protein